MGPPGYGNPIGPPPFVSPQEDPEWLAQQQAWSAGGAVPPWLTGAPDPAAAPPQAEEQFPPARWTAAEAVPPWLSGAGSVDAVSGAAPVAPGPPQPPTASSSSPAAPGVAPAGPGAKQARPAGTVTDPYVAGVVATTDQRTKAIDDQAAAQVAQNDLRAAKAQEAASVAALAMNDVERQREDARKEGQAKTKALADEVEALGKEKSDPRRRWHEASTLSKVATAIALFAGGMQSAFTGKNIALEAFQRMMDKDFEAQQADLANRREALGMKRSMLQEDLAQGRDLIEAKAKHNLAFYDMTMKGIDAEAAKYDSPQYKAKAEAMKAEVQQAAMNTLQDFSRYTEDKAFQRSQAKNQNALGWYNAKTSRMGQESDAAARAEQLAQSKAAAEAKANGKAFPIYGKGGPQAGPIGYAADQDAVKGARAVIEANAGLETQYKRGRELFKDGWAAPGTELRARQNQWNTGWASLRFRASGRTDAPSANELQGWGLDTGSVMGNNMAVLDESYSGARDTAAATLRSTGVPDATLAAEGFLVPRDTTEAGPRNPRQVTPLVYRSDKGVLNTDGDGTPLDEETSARILAQRKRDEELINENTRKQKKGLE